MGLPVYSGELIFGGAYYWKEFCTSKWVGLDNKNSLKHYKKSLKQLNTASTNNPWAYNWEGLLSEGFFCLRFGGFIFGRAHFLFFGGGEGGGPYYQNFTVSHIHNRSANGLKPLPMVSLLSGRECLQHYCEGHGSKSCLTLFRPGFFWSSMTGGGGGGEIPPHSVTLRI